MDFEDIALKKLASELSEPILSEFRWSYILYQDSSEIVHA